jgi:hypothetical protein
MAASCRSVAIWLLLVGESGEAGDRWSRAWIRLRVAAMAVLVEQVVGMHGKPCKRIGDAFGLGLKYPYAVAVVVVHGRSKVPAINGMGQPGTLNGGLFVHKHSSAGGANGVQLKSSALRTWAHVVERQGVRQEPRRR